MDNDLHRVEVNKLKLMALFALATGVVIPTVFLLLFAGAAYIEITSHGIRLGLINAMHSVVGPWSIFLTVISVANAIYARPALKLTKKEPLLWVAGDPRRAALRDYERKAYLSFVEAIKLQPSLGHKPLKDVYTWLREHGVRVDGEDYDLPDRATWLRYRSAGEKLARMGQRGYG